jgi:putative acetyltransferase
VHTSAFPTRAEARLVDSLLDGGRVAASFVAVADGCVVGHALLSHADVVDIAGIARAVLALAPVAVMPAYQGRGLGTELVVASLEAATATYSSAVIVLGPPGYYARFGFEPAAPHGIEPPFSDVPSEAWMVVETTAGGLAGLRGVVRYAPPFDELG